MSFLDDHTMSFNGATIVAPLKMKTMNVFELIFWTRALKNFESANYISSIADTDTFELWAENDRQDAKQRANTQWKTMLEQYEAPEIDPAIDEALLDFIDRKKRSVPDQWY